MEEKIKQLIQQYNKGGFTQSELEWELLNLYDVSGRSELLKAFVEFYNNRQNSDKRVCYDEIEIYLESL